MGRKRKVDETAWFKKVFRQDASSYLLNLSLLVLTYQDTLGKKNRSVMAGKAGALCETESWLMFVTSLPCFYSNQLFLRAEQVSASALRIFSCFTMMPPKGKPSFLLPMPQSQFCLHTGNIQLNILKWGGQKTPELSRTLLGLCFNNSLFQHILWFWNNILRSQPLDITSKEQNPVNLGNIFYTYIYIYR